MPQNSPLRFPLMATLLHKSIPTSPTPYPVRLPSFCPASLRPQFHFQAGGLNPFSRRNFLRASALNPDCSNNLSKTASSVPEEGNENPIGHKSDEIECVEVFGIGSRKDAVLDYCLNSPFLSPSLRFWKILVNDSPKVQLQQRFSNEDMTTRVVEAPSVLQPCSKAVILVASAAYGNDDIAAVDILREIMSKKGLFIGIILRPFSFEGRRRQDEVNHLVAKLQEYADFYVDVDTNTLLENDLVTLDEAVKTSNNAVLMAMNAISVLISEKHIKLHDAAHGIGSELKVPEIQKILKPYREAKIGFGAGFNIKSSVLQAMYDCPFLGINVKNSSGVIICILASSGIIDYHDITAILQVVRSTTGWKGEIIVSIVHDSKLDLNIIRTTIIAFGFIGQQSNKKVGIFSRLAQHFPFIFNILNKQSPQRLNTKGSFATECQHLSVEKSLENHYQTLSEVYHDSAYEDLGVNTQEVASIVNNIDEDTSFSRNHKSASQGSDTEFSDSDLYPFTYMQSVKDNHKLRECTKEGAADMDCNEASDSMTIYRLPVGVKRFQQFDDCPINNKHHKKWILEDSCKVLSDDSSVSWDAMGQRAYDANKQGMLSNRAASMLEAERDSPNKKWTPVLEIEYRGGIYHGRIQGGLPEGKGRLSFGDGSIYDGMWRFGKRSGLGTLYFKNGDVFQGLWRDDVMHGKGWLYFHTGDRWFVNFWKGKANGEGRFYSKLGEVFFGHFKDGLRHGHFLCIGVDGTRCHEVWEEGVLVSREQLEPDANDVA